MLSKEPLLQWPTPEREMTLFVTGATGVLGRALRPLAEAARHTFLHPDRSELDLFDPAAVRAAVRGVDAVVHLATRIQPLDKMADRDAWRENDRLRAEASAILVDAALDAGVETYVQPSIAFVYPEDLPATEDTPIRDDVPEIMLSALVSEQQTERFARERRRGVVLRLGLLDGPGTGNDRPIPALGSTLHVADAGRALLAALTVASGIYNVCRDGERVSNRRFSRATGWSPRY
jgi:nucleoside-diphosphate-sugar epimerase